MTETDEALFERAREGDVPAFERLYERFEGRLFAYCLSQLGDRAEAEDVFHDAFVKALHGPYRVEAGGFRAWIYRIARNLISNKLRSKGRGERAVKELASNDAAPSSAPDAGTVLESRELGDALERAVEKLPSPLAEVYRLRAAGLSYVEMASVLDAPIGTVKSRLHQMVRVLREELKPWIAP
jgi:RNA polymerase sigma-70 factor (ECF subfamily)